MTKSITIFICTFFAMGHFLMAQDTAAPSQSVEDSLNQLYPKTVVDHINSKDYTEYSPSISANGKTMVFESNRNGKWELFISDLENGEWSTPKALDSINNFGDSTDVISGANFSYDGNSIYFHASFDGGLGAEDIYYSKRIGDTWTAPINIGAPVNTRGFDGFPTLSTDGKTLYFVRSSEHIPDGVKQFCYEIYKTQLNDSGKWEKPVALPYPVNLGCEKAPRIMADNKTLIFASIRDGGIGGYDLYQSQVNEDGDWSKPIPLTYVNTPGNDLFSCISASGEKMFFSLKKDIYSVTIPPNLRQFKNITIQGYVRDADSKGGLPARIRITDANTSEVITEFKNNPSDGRYSIVLTAGRAYNLEVESKGYSSGLDYIDLRSLDSYNEYNKDFDLFTTAHLNINIYDVELYDPVPSEITVKTPAGRILNTVKNDGKDWRTVVNLPIGQKYQITLSGEHYKSQSFNMDLTGLIIYRDFEKDIEMVPDKVGVPINVSDLINNGKINSSQVVIRNQTRNEEIVISGNQTVNLRVGDRYLIEASSDRGYAFNSTEIKVGDEGKVKTINSQTGEESLVKQSDVVLKLQPLKKDVSLTLKNIYFESNSSKLVESSFEELNRVIKLMEQYPTMKVQVEAHTDDVGSAAYNLKLSDERASSVIDYLTENKVERERLVAKGYGEAKPVVPNDSEEHRAKNRRVELKIVDIQM